MTAGVHQMAQGASFWPERAQQGRCFGRRREPWMGLLLTLVTFGVYHFYFHAAAHAELVQQVGRRNRETPLVFAYAGLVAFGVVLGWAVLFVPLLLAAGVFWVITVRQFELLEEARNRLGLPAGKGAGAFFFRLVPGALVLVGPFFAYRMMMEEYNALWTAVRRGHKAEPAHDPAPASRREVPARAPRRVDHQVKNAGASNGRLEAPVVVAKGAGNGASGARPVANTGAGNGRSAFSVRDRRVGPPRGSERAEKRPRVP